MEDEIEEAKYEKNTYKAPVQENKKVNLITEELKNMNISEIE